MFAAIEIITPGTNLDSNSNDLFLLKVFDKNNNLYPTLGRFFEIKMGEKAILILSFAVKLPEDNMSFLVENNSYDLNILDKCSTVHGHL